MKKFILAVGAALLLAGCDKGGTSDNYGTSGGAGSSQNPSGSQSGTSGGANTATNSANPSTPAGGANP